MCDPVTAGLILTGLGTGTQVINNNAALRRQDRQLARGIDRQGEIQREASGRVNEQIAEIASSTGAAEQEASLDGFLNALRAADESSVGALPDVVGANQRFAENVSAGRQQVRGDATERAGRLSRIDAPGFQRVREALDVGRTSSDLGESRRRSQAEDFLTQLRVAEEQPNQFIDALGSIMSGAGSAIAMGGKFPNFMKGGPNLSKLAKAGTLIDAPIDPVAPSLFDFNDAARRVFR